MGWSDWRWGYELVDLKLKKMFSTRTKIRSGLGLMKSLEYGQTITSSDSSSLVIMELRKIIQAIDRNSKRLVRRVGLTMPQLVILQYVNSQTEVSVGIIAKNNHLGDATVTGILERLEKRGLISKRKSTRDKRRVLISITEQGRVLLDTAPPLMQEEFVDKFNELADWNQTMIYSALQQLSQMMSAASIEASPFLMVNPIAEIEETRTNI